MSKREQLNSYIGQVEKRLRTSTLLRGAAILTSAALAATVVLVLITNAFAFSSGSMTGARVLLLFAIVLAATYGIGIPLWGVNRRRAAGIAEGAFPEFQERLVTFAERDANTREPFIELLADDTLDVARKADPSTIVSNRTLLVSLAVGAASLVILVYLIVAGPGFMGYGAALLWTGPHAATTPFYDISVTPGDATVRRHADQLVVAKPTGVQTDKVRLFARYQSSGKWDEVAMQPQQAGSGFQFLFAGLPEGVEYYVQAGAVRSRHFNIRVVDMPAVKQIRVTYHYPGWTGLQNVVEEHGGDLRAVEGTDADLDILMDRPLRNGVLVLENGQQLTLSGGEGNWYTGTVHIDKDGSYHVAGLDQGQPVRLSEDFFIEARKANPPDVHIARPGRDYRASPIEEVTVSVQAEDEFGVNGMKLHYSVNGGPDKTVDLLKKKGQKEADGSTTLALEDFKLVPGDLVSLYATANDARAESRTDMMFVQVDPFEREFSQSQESAGGGGGGGGMGGDQNDISEREKEIIASTWKQEGQKNATQQQASESAKFLSGVQSTLRNQALSLAGRLQKRELTQENEEFNSFQQDMNAAAEAMNPAADRLQQEKWRDAIPNEEKALQYLLRAEATFRQIQVAFGNAGGGGGGGGAGRDLASLFDLELDTEKNQYETAQTGNSADQKAKDIDDALKKLDELARREQELADQQRNNTAQNFEQRWQQEMLRRDAEELQRQMEQMAQNGQQGQQGNSSSSSSSSSSGQSGQSQSGQSGGQSMSQSGGQSAGQSGSQSGSQSSSGQSQNGSDPRVQQALDRLRQANDDMRRAASQGQSEADARRAADRLREATNLLGGIHQQEAAGQLDSMAKEADQLAKNERDQMDRMRKEFGGQSGQGGGGQAGTYGNRFGNQYRYYGGGAANPQQEQLANDRQKLADDLAKLQQEMRSEARGLDSTNRAASSKLRDALGNTEQSDLETRIQRSADWLRRGVDPTANSNEGEVADDLQHLGDQIRQAQQALGNNDQAGPGQDNALDRVERLRNQLEGMSRNAGGPNGQGRQPGQLSRDGQQGQGQGSPNGQQGGNGPVGSFGPNGPNTQGGYNGGNVAGGNRYGGQGTAWWNYDTGNNSNLPTPAAPNLNPNPADTERTIQQGVNELNQLRDQVQNDPEAQRQIQDLINEMQRLDPSRFPGNPALVEQLHTQVLSDVDKLELQLSRNADDKQSGQVRSTDSLPVPAGYQDAVAEYFRRLSKHQ